MIDTLDRELNVGDQIVYAVRQSSSMSLVQADVVAVEDDRVKVRRQRYSWSKEVREVWLSTPHYIVLLEAPYQDK